MIFGIGADLVAIGRIEAAFRRHGERFLARLLTREERTRYEQIAPALRASWLAKRWAAKEAFAKALGTGIRAPFTLSAIGTTASAEGQPRFALSPEAETALRARGIHQAHLALTDDGHYAFAVVILERSDG
ncbi:MAG: holo-ACP synthase [Casimicrobiaceae bacterium]|nr:holo-ACP synthase [Casimicrobiaceae bacterium]MCX8099096.1 holo-ACP synthase [Casimicrobiaceae bacterium]MDW8312368.1 holo-ACP synthase [Burkholderiales bacterium]